MPVLPTAGAWRGTPTADYVEHLRTEELSVGTYCIPAGGEDAQSPHTEDEIYVVTAGQATFVDAGGAVPVKPGDTIFVAAGAEHRFINIIEDLAAVVMFAPPEYTRAPDLP
jgi:mannose-6-phosphate isomerase-like protein (cupin superfamily)